MYHPCINPLELWIPSRFTYSVLLDFCQINSLVVLHKPQKLLATEYNRIDCAYCADSSSATRIIDSFESKRQFLYAVRSAFTRFTRTQCAVRSAVYGPATRPFAPSSTARSLLAFGFLESTGLLSTVFEIRDQYTSTDPIQNEVISACERSGRPAFKKAGVPRKMSFS